MPKRRYRDTLTGGTGDVNPQVIRASVEQLTLNSYAEKEIDIPLNLPKSGTRATVMEILRIKILYNIVPGPEIGSHKSSWQLSTTSLPQIYMIDNPLVIATDAMTTGTVTTGSVTVTSSLKTYDMTDGAGHGYLIASDNLYFSVATSSFVTNLQRMAIQIIYRWKSIGLTEFIGILTSQS